MTTSPGYLGHLFPEEDERVERLAAELEEHRDVLRRFLRMDDVLVLRMVAKLETVHVVFGDEMLHLAECIRRLCDYEEGAIAERYLELYRLGGDE